MYNYDLAYTKNKEDLFQTKGIKIPCILTLKDCPATEYAEKARKMEKGAYNPDGFFLQTNVIHTNDFSRTHWHLHYISMTGNEYELNDVEDEVPEDFFGILLLHLKNDRIKLLDTGTEMTLNEIHVLHSTVTNSMDFVSWLNKQREAGVFTRICKGFTYYFIDMVSKRKDDTLIYLGDDFYPNFMSAEDIKSEILKRGYRVIQIASGDSIYRCKYCNDITLGQNKDILCKDCRDLFGHSYFHEL